VSETKFKGHKTGFNPKGSNDTTPNDMGPPATKFMGRGGLPEGPLKRYPGAVADISNGNRRLSKSGHGDGGGSGTSFGGSPSGFNRGRK
jgi:hypothetical protein